MSDRAPSTEASMWLPGPGRFARLLLGLTIFGAGEGLLVVSELGNSPWTVFAQGISLNTPLSIGAATIAISFGVLLLWIPLRQPPGLGTIANAIVVGLALEATVQVFPDDPPLGARWLLMIGAIALVALGSGFYLTAALGPGPRDGLMTGLHRRTGLSLRLVRASIEIGVLVAGFILGGTVGVGTVAFALAIGPGVQFAVERLSTPEWRALERRRKVIREPGAGPFLNSRG
jgi:uncharacterized membrane protein YczE